MQCYQFTKSVKPHAIDRLFCHQYPALPDRTISTFQRVRAPRSCCTRVPWRWAVNPTGTLSGGPAGASSRATGGPEHAAANAVPKPRVLELMWTLRSRPDAAGPPMGYGAAVAGAIFWLPKMLVSGGIDMAAGRSAKFIRFKCLGWERYRHLRYLNVSSRRKC